MTISQAATTPSGPPGDRPEAEQTESLDVAKRRYTLQRARYERTAQVIAEAVSGLLRQQAIPHLLSYRAKHPDNFAMKVLGKRRQGKYARLGEDPNQTVRDLAGVRVIVYNPADEPAVAEVIRKRFKLAEGLRADVDFVKPAMAERNEQSGYKATHILVQAPDGPEYGSIEGACCEIQICNVVAHVFNEIEHDIKYKAHDAQALGRTTDALERLRVGCRDLERMAVAVLKAHDRDVHDQRRELLDAEDLRHAFGELAGRPARGDFDSLFKLLAPLVSTLTVAALLGATGRTLPELLEAGGKRLISGHEDWSGDDALLLALGLLDTYGDELVRLAAVWDGSRPEIVRAILTVVNEAPEKG